jgi:putative endonuclease
VYYVYIIKSLAKKYTYVGYTDNLRRRFMEHNGKLNRSTKLYAPYKLIYYESYRSQSDAKWREQQLKRHAGALTALKRRLAKSLV